MGGGSGSGGSSTTSTKQGLPKWELPYAKGLTGQAQQLFTGQGYPQQNIAGFTPDQLAAMGGIEGLTGKEQGYADLAQQQNALLAAGQNPYINQALQGAAGLAGGTPEIKSAIGALSGLATGQDPTYQRITQANLGLLNDPSIQAAIAENQKTMSGYYTDPSKNTELQAYLQAGMDPIVRNYQKAIAPNLVSNAMVTGGLGSSATQSASESAQAQLAQQLGDYSASVIEPAYQQERQLQQQAIGMAPGLLSPEEQAIAQQQGLMGLQTTAAGAIPGMYQPQLAAQGQIPGLLAPQQEAIYGTPGLMQGAYQPYGQLLGIGGQQQQQAQSILDTLFQNQMMPYNMLQMGAGLIGPLSGGGSQGFQVSTQPGGSAK